MKIKEDGNFWIVYANLMAGLLFVFILLIGAVIVKYVLTQSDLKESKARLSRREYLLEKSKEELSKKEAIVFKKILNLINTQKVNLEPSKTKQLSEDFSLFDNKNRQLLILLAQLHKKDEEIENLQKDFQKVKQKIINLSLMRQNLSKHLQNKLDNVSIDEKTASIFLPAKLLFDENSYILKNEAKPKLRKMLSEYFDAILKDQNLLAYIENIIIQAHIYSDGSYIYHLDLSQKRAYELMNFIYTFYKDKKLQKLLIASGACELVFFDTKTDKNSYVELKFSIKNENVLKDVQKFFEFY